MKENQQPQVTYRKDYQPPAFLISHTELSFELNDDYTLVTAELKLQANPKNPQKNCILMGEKLELENIWLDNEPLPKEGYQLNEESLEIINPGDNFTLKTRAKIYPHKNTELEGLYQSSGNFCTQCEAEGFRKITWYLDRPDVLSLFTTHIIADAEKYPVMLSNGNLIAQSKLENGLTKTTWQDPFPKPCYLFALVAGKLVAINDHFITQSGRKVALSIYVEEHNRDKCAHAMQSLKNAMKWDEQVFGREYDLDIYMIVAVDDFNMGAMENKGLNIFNSRYVLADAASATDSDYQGIEAVIAHEYFHNWTGNRITCRDWFQLSLKEGLTVFRDQEFSSDMGSRAVKRIEDVRLLRARQFAEDAGPMAHPIRPDSYIEINNFYTLTVYEKGAEVIRMQHTLLGAEGFRKGMDLYFERHDGQAVTCDDFVTAMSDANHFDLEQFRQWYSQAGTPEITVSDRYDENKQQYTLSISQHTPDTPGQSNKPPLMIPFRLALINDQVEHEKLLILSKEKEEFVFDNIPSKPVPSLLRNFSAPVKLHYDYSDSQLAEIMAKDNDAFNRWEAGQTLASRIILGQEDGVNEENTKDLFLDSLEQMFDNHTDSALMAESLRLPDEITLSTLRKPVDIDGIYLYREALRKQIALRMKDKFRRTWQNLHDELAQQPYQPTADTIAKRALKNSCLAYLAIIAEKEQCVLAEQQYQQANNMTDQFSALSVMVNEQLQGFDARLADFEQQWQHDNLVMDKWFTLQATQKAGNTLDTVKQLMQHPAFSLSNPNKVRSLIGAFAMSNPVQFHHISGRGYQFLAQMVAQLDTLNPQVAARMVSAFNNWKDYDTTRQQLIQTQLNWLLDEHSLSKGVYEIVSKALAG